MSKKPSKSIQTIIITLFAGMIIPKIFDISGNALLDKFLWKGVLSVSFSLATVIVGALYAGKFISGKVAGGKSRVSIYFILIGILASVASGICAFIREISPIISIVLSSVTVIAISLLILKLIKYCVKVRKDFKRTQEMSLVKNEKLKSNSITSVNHRIILAEENISAESSKTTTEDSVPKSIYKTEIENNDIFNSLKTPTEKTPCLTAINTIDVDCKTNKTLFELWNERDVNKKCLTATNDENPDLKWVKIYKPPYPNGKFYGYVMMCNAHNTVNGEIYFADRAIWRIY